jgi:hypothetical protein
MDIIYETYVVFPEFSLSQISDLELKNQATEKHQLHKPQKKNKLLSTSDTNVWVFHTKQFFNSSGTTGRTT